MMAGQSHYGGCPDLAGFAARPGDVARPPGLAADGETGAPTALGLGYCNCPAHDDAPPPIQPIGDDALAMTRRAFTLVELLVTVAVIAVLLGLLLPALARSRDAARAAVCLSNLRQTFFICRAYANDHDGLGPAIGQPYASRPNWGLVVQSAAERPGTTPNELFTTTSILVCPACAASYGPAMTRTYAMNATGHAGAPADKDNYDDPASTAHIRFDDIRRTSETPLLVDSAAGVVAGNAPPPTRTASVIDFRNPAHVPLRLGRWHSAHFNAAMFDGSAKPCKSTSPDWQRPLP